MELIFCVQANVRSGSVIRTLERAKEDLVQAVFIFLVSTEKNFKIFSVERNPKKYSTEKIFEKSSKKQGFFV